MVLIRAQHERLTFSQQYATNILDFDFTQKPDRSEDSFGVEEKGRLMLIPTAKLEDLVEALEKEGSA